MNTPGGGSHRQACPKGELILSSEPFTDQVRQDPGRASDASVSTSQALKVRQRPRRAALTLPKVVPPSPPRGRSAILCRRPQFYRAREGGVSPRGIPSVFGVGQYGFWVRASY